MHLSLHPDQVIFWIVFLASLWTEKSLARVRRLKRGFWIVFATANAVMYCVFIVFVVVFSTLEVRCHIHCTPLLTIIRSVWSANVAEDVCLRNLSGALKESLSLSISLCLHSSDWCSQSPI